MLDRDLAALCEVETGNLNRAVKRNFDRIPEDFMFQIDREEWENLKCQFCISSWGGRRALPYAFTEHGVAMLSGVLNSDRAVQVNGRTPWRPSRRYGVCRGRENRRENRRENLCGWNKRRGRRVCMRWKSRKLKG